jgi:hypothetical protein
MQIRNRIFTAKGVLCSIAFGLAPCISASAVQPSLEQPPALSQQAVQDSLQSAPVQEPNTSQPDQDAAKAVVLTGTIVKSGPDFVLRGSSGTAYRLDAPEKAQPYEGKSVKVTGKLEKTANLLHVESIEEIRG